MYASFYDSPVGRLTLASDGEALTGLWIEGQKYYLGGLKELPPRREDLPVFAQAKDWLDRYFAGEKPRPKELPLRPEGSGFRKMIWRYLTEIPYGELTTYKELARRAAAEKERSARNAGGEECTIRAAGGEERLARAAGEEEHAGSMSAQAVGGAVGHNPISIVIPCHRVVGTDGSLTGYAAGLDVKRRLLKLEGAAFQPLKRRQNGSERVVFSACNPEDSVLYLER